MPPPKAFRYVVNTFSIECFHSRGQHLCKFIGTRESVCIRKEFKSHRIGLGHQHGRRFIVWDTNMAAVTSCENTLYVTLHFRDRRDAASLRHKNRVKITVMSEQKQYPVWFSCPRKIYPV